MAASLIRMVLIQLSLKKRTEDLGWTSPLSGGVPATKWSVDLSKYRGVIIALGYNSQSIINYNYFLKDNKSHMMLANGGYNVTSRNVTVSDTEITFGVRKFGQCETNNGFCMPLSIYGVY